ncbi:MAG: trypsin-like peptidase domain-containing protein [Verrucomicrobiota bacterium]
MKLHTRRLLALVFTFAAAIFVVAAVQTWYSGGSWFRKKFERKPYTLAPDTPLDPADVGLLSQLNKEYAKLTAAVVPSVVSIDTDSGGGFNLFDRRIPPNSPPHGQGSGVIVTTEGHVLTNVHVIAGQQRIKVTLHGGKTYNASVVGEDNLLDIAVLKIDSNVTFTPLKLGNSSKVQVGEIVFAVGNPFGLGETVTHGIISAKERSLSDNRRDYFQTDAMINPGNSGGPLVNILGEIIGINAAIFSANKEKPAFQGVGFSIPSNEVRDAFSQIMEHGKPIRGYLGVTLNDLDMGRRETLGYRNDGAIIVRVSKDSPAQMAGLQGDDIVRSVNDEAIHSMNQLLSLLQGKEVGSVIQLDIWRKGETLQIPATIGIAGPANQFTDPQ